MYSRYGSVSTVLDNFATFLTLMSRAYSDRSQGSTEPKSVPRGRVSATLESDTVYNTVYNTRSPYRPTIRYYTVYYTLPIRIRAYRSQRIADCLYV